MRLMESLREATRLLEREPALASMQKSKASAAAVAKALDQFLNDAKLALVAKDPAYIRLRALIEKTLQDRGAGLERLREACKKSGINRIPSKNRAEKVAEMAIAHGVAAKVTKHLERDPQTRLKDEIIAAASKKPDQIRGALKKMLTEKNAAKYGEAAGFEVVHAEVTAGKHKGSIKYDREATVDNAMEFLRPYIESMADAHR